MSEILDYEMLTPGVVYSDPLQLPNARYYWGDAHGRTFGTSEKLAMTAIAAGPLIGFVFGIDRVPTTVVAANVGDDGEAYIKMVEQRFEDFAQTRHGSKAYIPEFIGARLLGPADIDTLVGANVNEALSAFSSVINRRHA